MFPQTRMFLDAMREEEAGYEPPLPERDFAPDHMDPRELELVLKRKHKLNMLKRMLADSGYPNLARMSTIRREPASEGDDYGG